MEDEILKVLTNQAIKMGFGSKRSKKLGISSYRIAKDPRAKEVKLGQSAVQRIFEGKSQPIYPHLKALLNILELPCLEIYQDPKNLIIISQLEYLGDEDKDFIIKSIHGLKEYPEAK